jgi:uncharacterized protein
MMLRTLLVTAGMLVLLFLMVEWMRKQSLFYPQRYPAGEWNTEHLAVQPEDVWFETSDGLRLHGWYFSSGLPDAPLIVHFHGNGGNITHRATPAVSLASRGLDVFLFDYRGYGRSEGSPTEQGLYRDAVAAVEVMQKRARGPIVVYGESLGGPYAAYAAEKLGACAAVMDSTFPSIRAVTRTVYYPIPMHWLLRPGLRTADHLNDAGKPVLVMHSRTDEVLSFDLGRQLYEALEVPKIFYESASGYHAGISWSDGDRYLDAVAAFVEEYCPPAERS